MTDYTELKARAEAMIGFDDIPLAPDVILALIVENERLNTECKQLILLECHGGTAQAAVNLLAERDQLKAENERLSTENSEIESAAITYIEDMQEAQRENARLTELFTVGMTLDGNLRVYGDWQSVRKAQEILAERDQLRAEIAGLKTGYEAYEQVNAELKAECDALRKDAERYEWICANACDLNFYAVGPAPIRGCVEIDAEQYPVSEWGSAKTELDSIIDAALGQGEQS